MKKLKFILNKLFLILMTPFIFCVGGVLSVIFVWDHKSLIFVIEVLQRAFNKEDKREV